MAFLQPIHLAIVMRQPEVVTRLVQAEPEILHHLIGTPLLPLELSVLLGHAPMVTLLLDLGAAINHVGYKHETPLHIACSFGWAQVAEVLCQRGADQTLLTEDGATPLARACR